MYEVILMKCLVNQMTLFYRLYFILQGCSARKKGSVSQNITGAWGKNLLQKTAGSIEEMNFFLKQKK